MRRERKKLVRVRDESELQAGMLLVDKHRCLHCRAPQERFMLMGATLHKALRDFGRTCYDTKCARPSRAWRVLGSCDDKAYKHFCDSLRNGRLYRVDLGIDDYADQSAWLDEEARATARLARRALQGSR